MKGLIDCHTHLLPNIDDGSDDVKTTMDMLMQEMQGGVDKIILTPHFYADKMSVAKFLEKRDNAITVTKMFFKQKGTKCYGVTFISAGEIYYFDGISKAVDLDLLCIGKGDYILLEMPFKQWDDKIIKEVKSIIEDRGKKVIIAHIERYIDIQKNKKPLNELLSLPVIFQINGGSFLEGFFSKKWCFKFIKEHDNVIIGSDCHNMGKRPPNVDRAASAIEKKMGADRVKQMMDLALEIFKTTKGTTCQ